MDAEEGKINEKSIILDQPDLTRKVYLDISEVWLMNYYRRLSFLTIQLSEYTIYPGQIVVLFGMTDEGGNQFYCQKIYDGSNL